MRTLMLSLILLGLAAAPPADKKNASLRAGDDLPGPFHPYNVTGPHKNHYHSVISERGLDPMVLIFHKNMDVGDPLRNLLRKLDAAIEKGASARLGSFVVFLPDDLKEVAGRDDASDDARDALAVKASDVADALKLKHVVLCLDSKTDVESYHLSDANLVTVVLYKKLKIAEVFALPKSDFTDKSVDKIMAAVSEKLDGKSK